MINYFVIITPVSTELRLSWPDCTQRFQLTFLHPKTNTSALRESALPAQTGYTIQDILFEWGKKCQSEYVCTESRVVPNARWVRYAEQTCSNSG
jgi:hypothetical protein